jgi:hypothetical protein
MAADSRPLCRSAALAVLAVLPAVLHGGSQSTSPHYTIARDGSEADVAFARRWLDAAEQLMSTKYHVVPDRYRVSVTLLDRPAGDIDTAQSGELECCATDAQGRKVGSILLLGPSAPIWKQQHLTSSLGLPKDGEDYHAKVLMSEYIPVGHYAVQDSRPAGGWQYYAAPDWFVQGLQEYDGIYHTTTTNRTQTAEALMNWARQHEPRFTCCADGIELSDVYNGGAAFMAFLAAEFGEDVHARLLRDGAGTFDEALANETRPLSRTELFGRFRAWVRESK